MFSQCEWMKRRNCFGSDRNAAGPVSVSLVLQSPSPLSTAIPFAAGAAKWILRTGRRTVVKNYTFISSKVKTILVLVGGLEAQVWDDVGTP
jgi:hypothetical protein